MSMTIELNNKQLNSNEGVLNMNFLPAKIKGDGEANVDKYFNVYTQTEHGFLKNSLRGYPLQGEKQTVPSGYKGIVLQETSKPLSEDADRVLRVKGTFEQFTYWNYDKIPSASDGYKQALQLLNIAEVLAEPISEAEVQKALKLNEHK